ncbi:threonine aldolase [Aliidiomarina iranensis]|uniref:Threonine aldolase n=1 Tax=Aliidiomarina iranensis TaxID=1434071 RepID=A0A432W0S8_9GAMM|nr:beta-eliminating lyase-related protein [Aliidiomarina iranensis]RUO22588.1 threonine aldolase [Aliidiomarina iranensis]
MKLVSLLRQPVRSMADTLRELANLAEGELAAELMLELKPELKPELKLKHGAKADIYGKGPLIEGFEQEMAELFGKPAALFLPSGTLAQPLALKIYAEHRNTPRIGLHPTSHLLLHEQQGYQHLWGLDACVIGSAEQVWALNDFSALPEHALAAMVWELPAREIGGQLPSWQALEAQVAWARERSIAVHFDGARLWQCPAYYERSLAEIAALADSVYVSFYKDLAGISGAMLLGEVSFIEEARVWARRAGGNLYSQYPYLLAAKFGVKENLASIPAAVEYTRELAAAFCGLSNVRILPNPPQVAMFHLYLQADKHALVSAIEAYKEQHQVEVLPLPRAEHEGWQICELPIGRNAMAKPVTFWAQHLQQLLATIYRRREPPLSKSSA